MAFKPPSPPPRGLWRRTPPAIFPPLLGLMSLGLGWRRGLTGLGLPDALAEALLGGATLMLLFAVVAYVAKPLRRPGALIEELRILPGRAGVAAGVLALYLAAAALAPYAPELGRGLLYATLALHGGFILLMLGVFATGPREQRRVTPVWHLTFVGPIVGALAALQLGLPELAFPIWAVTLPIALLIWGASALQFARETVPPPLRPLLAIHLAPVSILGSVSLGLDLTGVAMALGWASLGLFAALILSARWLTEAGFSPFWGAFTFPLAATAGFWIGLGGIWTQAGLVLLIAATLVIVPIVFKVMQSWARGQLALRTNAATA